MDELHAQAAKYPYGLIAGGMEGGTVNIWDPQRSCRTMACRRHRSGACSGTRAACALVNPHVDSSHLLASGGSDNEVFIMALERADAPTIFSPGIRRRPSTRPRSRAWNSQVSHILATGDQSGSVMVWDIKASRPW